MSGKTSLSLHFIGDTVKLIYHHVLIPDSAVFQISEKKNGVKYSVSDDTIFTDLLIPYATGNPKAVFNLFDVYVMDDALHGTLYEIEQTFLLKNLKFRKVNL